MTRSKQNRRTAPSEDPPNFIDTNATVPDHEQSEERVAEAQVEMTQPRFGKREDVGEIQSEVAEIKVEEGDIAEPRGDETPVDGQSGHPNKILEIQDTQSSPPAAAQLGPGHSNKGTQDGPTQNGPATPGNRSLHQMQDGIKLNKASPTHYRLKGNVKKLGSMWEQK